MKKTNYSQNHQNQSKNSVSIDFSKTSEYKCDNPECNGELFMPATKFRKVSKLIAGTTEDQLIPIQVFVCMACGNVNKDFDINVG